PATRGSFSLRGDPPIGGWAFFPLWRGLGVLGGAGGDILWLRMARSTHNLSLLVPIVLTALAAILAARVWTILRQARGATRAGVRDDARRDDARRDEAGVTP